MGRSVQLLLLAGLVVVGAGAGAAHANCKAPAAAQIEVTVPPPAISHDQALSRDQILQHVRSRDPSGGGGYDAILGVTDTNVDPDASIDYIAMPQAGGGYCVSLTKITVVVQWKIDVHVASELRPGSCMYGVVLNHEDGHVDIDRKVLGLSKSLIQKNLAAIARNAVAAATPEAGGKRLQGAGSAALSGAVDKLQAELERRQNAHDTPEEYAKGEKICGVEENNRALGG
jgi:hypothetical protein